MPTLKAVRNDKDYVLVQINSMRLKLDNYTRNECVCAPNRAARDSILFILELALAPAVKSYRGVRVQLLIHTSGQCRSLTACEFELPIAFEPKQ